MTTRIEGGAVARSASLMTDAGASAGASGLGTIAAAAGAAATVAAKVRANSLWTQLPVLPAWPRTAIWLVPDGPNGIARPRGGYAPAPTEYDAAPTAAEPAEKATTTSPLDFLRDSRLSAEEKLVLLLAQQQKDTEKEIEAVLKKAEAKSAKKTSGGVLKKLTFKDMIKTFSSRMPLLEKLGIDKLAKGLLELSGPVLAAGATAIGMPHLAPAALALGPDLLKALDTELPIGGTEAKATANAPNAGTGSSNALDPVETQRLTLLVNRQQQWAGTVSNLLHNLHQTRMNVIQNLR